MKRTNIIEIYPCTVNMPRVFNFQPSQPTPVQPSQNFSWISLDDEKKIAWYVKSRFPELKTPEQRFEKAREVYQNVYMRPEWWQTKMDDSMRSKLLEAWKKTATGLGAWAGAVAGWLWAMKWVGKALEVWWKTVYWLTLPPTSNEAGATQAYLAGKTNTAPRTTVDTALESPMFQKWQFSRQPSSVLWQYWTRAQIWVQSLAKSDQIFKDTIEPIFKQADEVGIQFKFDDLKKQALKNVEDSTKFSIQEKANIADDIVDLFDDMKWETSLKNLDLLKREITNKLPLKYRAWATPTHTLPTARQIVSSTFRNNVHDTIAKEFGTNSAQLYQDYANLKWLAKMWQKSMTQAWIQWGAGAFISTVAKEAATPVTTTAGKTSFKIWKALQKLPDMVLSNAKRIAKDPNTYKNIFKWAKNLIKAAPVWIIWDEVWSTVLDTKWQMYDFAKSDVDRAIEMLNEWKSVKNISTPFSYQITKGMSDEESLKTLQEIKSNQWDRPEESKAWYEILIDFIINEDE